MLAVLKSKQFVRHITPLDSSPTEALQIIIIMAFMAHDSANETHPHMPVNSVAVSPFHNRDDVTFNYLTSTVHLLSKP
jgi:hypothetical protein